MRWTHIRASERPFAKRMEELTARALRGWEDSETEFLTPREAQMAVLAAERAGVYWISEGGHPEAERVRIRFFAQEGPGAARGPEVLCVYAERADGEGRALAHRDYLGSILNLGIERNRVGDILVEEAGAYVFCATPAAGLLLREWKLAGREPLRPAFRDPDASRLPLPRTEERTVSLQSLRIDALVARAFQLSRSDASELARAGKVQLNYAVCADPAEDIQEQDMVSVRGFGRVRVTDIGGASRSGRTFVRCRVYV